jgi:hypothetical protein
MLTVSHACCTSPNGIVTNHEAQLFPMLRDASGKRILFDRVLADVPCSGDGTLRKNADLWPRWRPTLGLGLHRYAIATPAATVQRIARRVDCLVALLCCVCRIQVQIALRGVQLLSVGGRMVYSTCSMHPAENEAVVAELLRRCQGALEIVDTSQELTGLIRRPGITSWKVRRLSPPHWLGTRTRTRNQPLECASGCRSWTRAMCGTKSTKMSRTFSAKRRSCHRCSHRLLKRLSGCTWIDGTRQPTNATNHAHLYHVLIQPTACASTHICKIPVASSSPCCARSSPLGRSARRQRRPAKRLPPRPKSRKPPPMNRQPPRHRPRVMLLLQLLRRRNSNGPRRMRLGEPRRRHSVHWHRRFGNPLSTPSSTVSAITRHYNHMAMHLTLCVAAGRSTESLTISQ